MVVSIQCGRCARVTCDGVADEHFDFYVLPPSISRLRGPRQREQGEWCRCCLGRVWRQVRPLAQTFLTVLAASPDTFVETGFTPQDDQRASLQFSRAVRDLGLGVKFPEMTLQPVLSTPNMKWGTPYAYNESRAPKRYLLPLAAAEIVFTLPTLNSNGQT